MPFCKFLKLRQTEINENLLFSDAKIIPPCYDMRLQELQVFHHQFHFNFLAKEPVKINPEVKLYSTLNVEERLNDDRVDLKLHINSSAYLIMFLDFKV